MPFEWNTTAFKSTNAFLHEELRIPKSIKGLSDVNSFEATANGFPVRGRMLAVDPYSFEKVLALHYLLNKFDLMAMSEKMPPGSRNITFTLSPSSNSSVQTTTDMTTETGGIRVMLTWNPIQSSAGNESTVKLDFSDSAYGRSLKANVMYDFSMWYSNGTEVIHKMDMIATSGTDIQTLTFSKNDIYHIQVKVKELDRTGQVPDLTRKGIARGIVVVPEFGPSLPALVMALAIVGVVATSIVFKRRGSGFG